jgi:1,4-alpha-glucan branching enzyme
MESDYAEAGVEHFMVDGPALHGDTGLGRPVGSSDVIAFGRDLPVSYRVWSPRSGYPGHSAYRDFHTYDHRFGLKASRVTGRAVEGADKKPYEPERTRAVLQRHVDDFVTSVRARLTAESERIGRPALVVAAFDTELFGHWWHEGPQWLDAVLRALPRAGVRVGSLQTAKDDGYVGEPVDLPQTSWGSGKDWRVWNGPQVRDLVRINAEVVTAALTTVDKRMSQPGHVRDRVSDQILRETLMMLSSDWPFMVSKDTAADYARERLYTHAHAAREICEAADRGRESWARTLSERWGLADNVFAGLDARRLPAPGLV